MKNIALYFGSFNPIHRGHIAIAEYMIERRLCDGIWMVVSALNPFKEEACMIDSAHRLQMVDIAIAQSKFKDDIQSCGIEFELPKPSYTIDTLEILERLNPDLRFSILIGADNVDTLDGWKEYRRLLDKYPIYAYPRKGYTPTRFLDHVTVLYDATLFEYSSTNVRDLLLDGDDVSELVCADVYNYIKTNHLWNSNRN